MVTFAALVSGGKDSLYSCYLAMQKGWELTELVTILPEEHSMMFQYQDVHLVEKIGKLMNVPVIMEKAKEDELVALERALSRISSKNVVAGALQSDYQHHRINMACEKLGLKTFSPLWRKNEDMLIEDILSAGFEPMIVAVAAEGLGEEFLGKKIDAKMVAKLKEIRKKTGIHIMGEGGEFETIVTNCPMYSKPLDVKIKDTHWHENSGWIELE